MIPGLAGSLQFLFNSKFILFKFKSELSAIMLHSEKFHFNWKIKNFSMLPHKTGEGLNSAYFSTPIFKKAKFYISLYPKCDKEDNKNCLSCFIHRKKDDDNPITIGFSMTLESIDSSHSICRTAQSCELVTNWGFSRFVEVEIINENKNLYVPGDVLSINCVVWAPEIETTPKSSDDFSSKTYLNKCSTSLTQFQVGKQSVIWPISEIHKCLESKKKIHFSVESFIETHPSFKLSFSHGNKADLEHAQIEIVQTKSFSKKTNIFVKCQITVVSAQKEYLPSQTDTFSFDSNAKKVWYFPKFIEITHLEEGKYIHLYDTLYLSCEFSFTTEGDPVYHTEIPSCAYDAFKVTECARATYLSNSISKLYLDNQFCDVTLQVDNKSFLAHKVVLCAQSPVFCAMFKNETKEKITNVVEVTDVDVDTMKLMLDFLHCDILKEDLSTQDICKLYSAADKYQISHFKQKCKRLLLSSLSVAEVCEVLILADVHQDDFLMSCIHNFVKYHANEIFYSSRWEEFNNENPILSGRIMLQVLKST